MVALIVKGCIALFHLMLQIRRTLEIQLIVCTAHLALISLRPFYTFTDRITDHPGSSLRDHPCYLRHYRVYTGEASGVILGVPAYPGKKLSLLNFSSRSSRMKQSVLFPVGTVYLRVAAEYIRDSPCRHREVRINTGFIRV